MSIPRETTPFYDLQVTTFIPSSFYDIILDPWIPVASATWKTVRELGNLSSVLYLFSVFQKSVLFFFCNYFSPPRCLSSKVQLLCEVNAH